MASRSLVASCRAQVAGRAGPGWSLPSLIAAWHTAASCASASTPSYGASGHPRTPICLGWNAVRQMAYAPYKRVRHLRPRGFNLAVPCHIACCTRPSRMPHQARAAPWYPRGTQAAVSLVTVVHEQAATETATMRRELQPGPRYGGMRQGYVCTRTCRCVPTVEPSLHRTSCCQRTSAFASERAVFLGT